MDSQVAKKTALVLMIVAILTAPGQAFAKNFFEQLLESNVSGSSSSQSNNPDVQQYNNNRQSLSEDKQRLDEAYSQIRQKQAAGQDVSADLENLKVLEATYVSRSQQVRGQEQQFRRQERYQQRNQYRENRQQLDDAYYQLRQKQSAGLDTTQDIENIRYMEQQMRSNRSQYGASPYRNNYRRNSFNNNGYNEDNWQDDQNNDNGFKFGFGG